MIYISPAFPLRGECYFNEVKRANTFEVPIVIDEVYPSSSPRKLYKKKKTSPNPFHLRIPFTRKERENSRTPLYVCRFPVSSIFDFNATQSLNLHFQLLSPITCQQWPIDQRLGSALKRNETVRSELGARAIRIRA